MSDNKPTSEDEFWNRVMQEKPVNDLQAAKVAAQQLVAITSILQGLLLAVFSLKDLRPLVAGWKVLLLISPSFFWLTSLMFSVRVFAPGNIPVMNKEDWRGISQSS